MASGKRASMREGPLAALFRKTDEDGAAERGAGARRTAAPRGGAGAAGAPPRAVDAVERRRRRPRS